MLNNAYRYFAGSYFQLIPLTIIIQACIGSVAVYYMLQGIPDLWDMIQLLCCVAATTSYLGAILAQIHVRKVFHISHDHQHTASNNSISRLIFATLVKINRHDTSFFIPVHFIPNFLELHQRKT